MSLLNDLFGVRPLDAFTGGRNIEGSPTPGVLAKNLRELNVVAQEGRGVELLDSLQDQGIEVENTMPNMGLHQVKLPEGLSPGQVGAFTGVKQVQPQLELPFYSAAEEVADLTPNVFRLMEPLPQAPISQADGAERSSLPDILDTVNVSQLQEQTLGEDAVIAVIDSGISKSIIPPERRLEGFAPDGADPYKDPVGHGSMCAGIAAGDKDTTGVRGVAPEADVISCRATTGETGGFKTKTLVQAQEYLFSLQNPDTIPAEYEGVRTVPNSVVADTTRENIVINNSWGLTACTFAEAGRFGPCSSVVVQQKVREPIRRGMSVVFSAGNNAAACNRPYRNSIYCGPSLEGVTSVGALQKDLDIQPYSSRGPGQCSRVNPSTVTPTYGVLPWADGFRDFGERGGGTSSTAPIAAGVTALLRTLEPNQSPWAYKRAIEISGSNIALNRPSPYNPITGFGLLDAVRARQALSLTTRTTGLVGGEVRKAIQSRRASIIPGL